MTDYLVPFAGMEPVKIPELLLPFQKHSDTSREAAESMKPHVRSLKDTVYVTLVHAKHGMTAEEICTATGLKGDTVRPRIVELVREDRIIVAGKRKTKSGRNADVWVARG